MKTSQILGMNARDQLYTSLNSNLSKSICSSKYTSKIILMNKEIPTAELYGLLTSSEDINHFNWSNLEKNFVIKPTNGNAGKGVVAFRRKQEGTQNWLDTTNKLWSLEDIKLHCYDILEGQYSTYGSNHQIIIEERIPIHPKLLKFSVGGTPDIRIFVFNQVPVMAALRLPTAESGGRANLTQGAIGVGIDMATGVTTHALHHKTHFIKYLPGTKRKLNGIKIPFWNQVLKIAVEASNAAELTFSGIDLFLHKEKGPMVVELNANPGLSFQIINKTGLRKRLERVEDLKVLNPDHGVRISQALFAESFADKIIAKDGLTIISPKETALVYGDDKKTLEVPALINTGRFRSAIADEVAKDLGLIDLEDLLWFQTDGNEGSVPVVEVKIKIKDRKIETAMVVSKRLSRQNYKIEIGRKDLAGFLVNSNPES